MFVFLFDIGDIIIGCNEFQTLRRRVSTRLRVCNNNNSRVTTDGNQYESVKKHSRRLAGQKDSTCGKKESVSKGFLFLNV